MSWMNIGRLVGGTRPHCLSVVFTQHLKHFTFSHTFPPFNKSHIVVTTGEQERAEQTHTHTHAHHCTLTLFHHAKSLFCFSPCGAWRGSKKELCCRVHMVTGHGGCICIVEKARQRTVVQDHYSNSIAVAKVVQRAWYHQERDLLTHPQTRAELRCL